jgi:hypothetical protein
VTIEIRTLANANMKTSTLKFTLKDTLVYADEVSAFATANGKK